MRKNWLISRRTALKGLGVSLALPLLETMGWAETPKSQAAYKPPVRLGFMYMPFGVYPKEFWPEEGMTWPVKLPSSLEPLRPLIDQCLLLDGLINVDAGPLKNTTHDLELSTWLTATRPDGSQKEIISIAQSIDQTAAQHLGLYTALPSLEVGTQNNNATGLDSNSGLHKMYCSSGNFLTPTQALPVETSPANVLKRLFSSRKSTVKKKGGPQVDQAQFANPNAAAGEEKTLDRSMLDLVRESAKDLRDSVSLNDRQRLDDYLDTIRSLETRIAAIERQQAEAAQSGTGQAGAASSKGTFKRSDPIEVKIPEGKPKWSDHVRVMGDLIVLAFQADVTRVASLITSNPFGVGYPELGFKDGHHTLSHHSENTPEQLERIARIDRFNIEQFAYVIGRMKELREGAGTLLDNSIMMWGSGMGSGPYHTNKRLPTIIAGKGGGTIRTGRYVKQVNGNHGDLLTAILARAGVPIEKPIGNGTKMLPDLS